MASAKKLKKKYWQHRKPDNHNAPLPEDLHTETALLCRWCGCVLSNRDIGWTCWVCLMHGIINA